MIDAPLHAEDVANYLNQNREFFHVFPNLLDELSIPHPKTGKAVSLLERQVHQLREQRDALKIEVDTLLDIAGENGQLFAKVQDFTRQLIHAQGDQAGVDCIFETMKSLFNVEQVALVTWETPKQCLQGMSQLGVSQTWSSALKKTLEVGQPVCGLLEDSWQNGLFHTKQPMHSVCILPLGHNRVWGALALGEQSERFHPNLGTYFLKIMAELITAKFDHLFNSSD